MTDEPSRGGRPPFRPTPAQRQQVENAASLGASQDTIALILGIDRNTLAKYFGQELAKSGLLLKIEALGQLRSAAKKGNVSAMKKVADMADAAIGGQAMDQWQWTDEGKPSQPRKPGPKLGKKEQAQIEAKRAGEGTEWDGDLSFDGGLPN